MPEAPQTVDSKIAEALRATLEAYLPVAKALADDDFESARKAAGDLLVEIQRALPPAADSLGQMTQNLIDAKDIKDLRNAFYPLSDKLIALIRENGIDSVGNAYVVHCPMAADGKGGDWLSAKPTVLNPYFGDTMLHCGSVAETLSTDKSAPAVPVPGHDH